MPEHTSSHVGTRTETYEKYFVPAIGLPVARDLIEIAALRPGERVLDVACGTGIVARLAAERVGASGFVAGLDALERDVTARWQEFVTDGRIHLEVGITTATAHP